MGREIVILSEIRSGRERQISDTKYYMISLICGI